MYYNGNVGIKSSTLHRHKNSNFDRHPHRFIPLLLQTFYSSLPSPFNPSGPTLPSRASIMYYKKKRVCVCVRQNYRANCHQTWHMEQKVPPRGEHGLSSRGFRREGRRKCSLNVDRVALPGGGRGYYKSALEITCIFALHTSPGWEATKPTSMNLDI